MLALNVQYTGNISSNYENKFNILAIYWETMKKCSLYWKYIERRWKKRFIIQYWQNPLLWTNPLTHLLPPPWSFGGGEDHMIDRLDQLLSPFNFSNKLLSQSVFSLTHVFEWRKHNWKVQNQSLNRLRITCITKHNLHIMETLSPIPFLSPFPHSPSISSPFSHFLPISSQPGCKAAAGCDSLVFIGSVSLGWTLGSFNRKVLWEHCSFKPSINSTGMSHKITPTPNTIYMMQL